MFALMRHSIACRELDVALLERQFFAGAIRIAVERDSMR